MMGKGQDAKILSNGEGLTHREMNWFKTCGRNIHGEWSTTAGIIKSKNECRRTLVTGAKDGEFEGEGILPFRAILFAMDVTVKNQLEDMKDIVALREGKCGSHICNHCESCIEDIDIGPTMCCMDERKICDGCWEC